jgi:BlaI family transcriptional regulator, penicillinase repressor
MSSDRIVLTDREAELMEVLWDRGPSTVAEVREALPDDLAYTTVLTMLRTLETKGFIEHTGEGRAHRYAALVERDAARQSALRELSRKLFKGSASLLLTHLVSDHKLSATEVRRIRALLDEATKKGKT